MSKSWVIGWLTLGILLSSVAVIGFQARKSTYMVGGFVPVQSKVDSFRDAAGWIKRLLRRPEPGEGKARQPKEKTVASISEISSTDEAVTYCNDHPNLVNKRLYGLKRHMEEKYGREVTLPSERSQGHVLTYDSEKIKLTFILENKKFQKIVGGFKGNNVYGKVKSEEGFFVKEIKLFLKGKYDKAERKAKRQYGRSYEYKRYKAAFVKAKSDTLQKVALTTGIEGLALVVCAVSRKLFAGMNLGIAGASVLAPFVVPILPVFGLINSLGLMFGHNKIKDEFNIGAGGKAVVIGAAVIASIAIAILI